MHIGDTAVALLKAGAEIDRRDVDGFLAIDLAPDKQVCAAVLAYPSLTQNRSTNSFYKVQSVRDWI